MPKSTIPPTSPVAAPADNYYKKLNMEKEKKELRIRFDDAVFNIEYEGGVATNTATRTSSNSSLLTEKEYSERIDILEKWARSNYSSDSECNAFRKSNPNGYKLVKKYVVVPYMNGKKFIYALEPGSSDQPNHSELKIVVHQGMVFDVIYNAHHDVGHKKSATTHNKIKQSYVNVSEKLVKTYIDKFCPTCNHDFPKQKPQVGCHKPINSFQYRDRAQADLVDFRQDPQHMIPDNPETPVMRWLLVIKDHLSRIVYARPIQKKEVDQVAFEISHYFSYAGYPLILQTDNGTEFGAHVLRKMKEINPEMICVRGRVRKPSDQGSVERSNQDIKKITAACVHDRRNECSSDEEKKKIAWTTEYQHGMRAMNCSFSRGTGNMEPYEIVFGQRYHAPMVASLKTQSIDCPETLEELRGYLSKQLVAKYKGLGYFDDDDVPDVLDATASISDAKSPQLDSGLQEVAKLANFVIQPPGAKPESSTNSARKKLKMPSPSYSGDSNQKRKLELTKFEPAKALVNVPALDNVAAKKRKSEPLVASKHKSSLDSDSWSSDDLNNFLSVTSSPASMRKDPLAPASGTPSTPASMRKDPPPPASGTPSTRASMRKDPPPPASGTRASMRKDPPPPASGTPSTRASMRGDVTSNAALSSSVAIKEEVFLKKTNRKEVNISIEEAFSKQNSDVPYVCGTLSCRICGHKSPFLLCAVFRKKQVEKFHLKEWLTTDFICAFLLLQSHQSHLDNKNISDRIILFHCQHQEDEICMFRETKSSTEHIVTYAHTSDHYCLLQFDLKTKVILVHDGFQEKVSKWLTRAHCVLRKFRLVPVDSMARRVISTANSRDSFDMKKRSDDKWIMQFSGHFQQADGHSCGILCCATAWELFDQKPTSELTGLDHMMLRQKVINQYEYLVRKFSDAGSLRVRKNPVYIDIEGNDTSAEFNLLSDDDISLPEHEVSSCAKEVQKRFKDKGSSRLLTCTPPRGITTNVSSSIGKKTESPGSNEKCYICLCTLKQSNASCLVLPCTHSAHVTCLRNWAETSPTPTCPVCREGIPDDFVCFAKAVTTKMIDKARNQRHVKTISDRRVAVTAQKGFSRMVHEARARSRQHMQAKKMIKNAALHSTLAVGDVVSIDVPANVKVRCSPLSPVGVILSVSHSKTYAVAVPGGVVTDQTSTGKKTKWFSYNDLRKRDSDTSRLLPDKLQEWRGKAMSSGFQAKDYPAISLQKAQGELIGSKHQGSYICKCNPEKGCNKRCKCVAAGTLCHSSCKCGGKCNHTQEKTTDIS